MIVILEAFLILAAIACLLGSLYFFLASRGPQKTEAAYTPPETPPGYTGPPIHLRVAQITIFWTEIGQPRKVGTQVEVNMQSGRVAIYEVKNVAPAQDADWSWYDLEFVRYADKPNGDVPVSSTTK